MSTHLPDEGSTRYWEPVTLAGLLDYFHRGGKPKSAWRVGAEFEKFAVERVTGRALSYDEPGGIQDILQALVDRYGWAAHHRNQRLIMLSRGGSTISLEPGGQLEFSSPPVKHLDELATELMRHRDEIRAVVDGIRVAWVAAGVTPFAKVEEIPQPVRRRHRLMASYLPERCPMALHMMKATASTQAAFDYADEPDAMRKFTVALTLGPVINAIWGNSTLYGGEATGWVSYRGRIWLGMDPDRSGLLPELLADGLTFERWVRYLLDLPMLFVVQNGEYLPAGGRTFRAFMNHGIDGRFPTLSDWEVHLTTVFPEVRLKHFLEVRGADACPPALALAVPAMWKGLLYDTQALSAAEDLAKHFPPATLPGLFEAAAQKGLAAVYSGHSLLAWAGELADIAHVGLSRQAKSQFHEDENKYLAPVVEILDNGLSPGMALQTMGHFTPMNVLPQLEY